MSGIPASVSTSLANLMVLSPVPADRAPGFTLTDQNGHTLSLASLHGKVVVLQFMDPHCTDICPIVSAEFVKAYHDLGPLASKVVFAAVNVNAYHTQVQAMAKYTRAQALNTIPSWHFFTGPVPALEGRVAGLQHPGLRAQRERRRPAHLGRVLHRPAGPGTVPGLTGG